MEQGVDIIDVHAILAKQLELASGDGYHWQSAAYQIISQESGKSVLPVLGK